MRKSDRQLKHNNSKIKLLLPILILLLMVLAILVFIFLKVFFLEKFVFINSVNKNDAEIIIVDGPNDRVTKYLIPAETELESARGYGHYKLFSLWELGRRDKIYGKLIAETVLKNFSIPVYLWKDGSKSNLNIYQKIKAKLLTSRQYQYQITTSTIDKLPSSVLINFADSGLADYLPKITVEDLTGTLNTIDRISRIIETIGFKITSNSKGYNESLDCKVSGKNEKLLNLFENILDCRKEYDPSLESDLKLSLGAKFAERF